MSSIVLDGQTWDLTHPALVASTASVASAMERAKLRENVGPSGLLGLAAASCSQTNQQAVARLVNDYAFIRTDAKDAVALGRRVAEGLTARNQPLGYLAAAPISAAQEGSIRSLLTFGMAGTGKPAYEISLAETARRWRLGHFRQLANLAVDTGDPSVAMVAAGLGASMRFEPDHAWTLVDSLSHNLATGGRKLTRRRWAADRVVSAAYAMGALDKPGLDLGDRHWDGAAKGWRFRAAPWVLPLLEQDNGSSLAALLDAVAKRNLDFVAPGTNPLPYGDDTAILKDTLAIAKLYAKKLTKWSDRPLWFDGGKGEAQVLLTQDEDYMYAWVGRDGNGVLVSFDTATFVGYGMDEVGVRAALAHAVGWFLDVSLTIRRSPSGSGTLKRTGAGNKIVGYRYVPTPTYSKQVTGVARGTNRPPRLTSVQAHIRRYTTRTPSSGARARAPRRIRAIMTSQDTFVRAYVKGTKAVGELNTRLSSSSMLADVIGRHTRARRP